MKEQYVKLIAGVLVVTSVCACSEVFDDFEPKGSTSLEEVPISLDFQVADMYGAGPATKSASEGDEISSDIKNICILQFNGTDDNAQLVGEVHYLVDGPEADEENRLDYNNIKLISSQGSEHTLVFLANTFGLVPRFTTLGEIREQTRFIACQQDLFGYADESGSYYRMNAQVVTRISGNTHVSVLLKRSVARVRVNLNNTGADGLVISSLQMFNVSRRDYLLSNYGSFHTQKSPLAKETIDYQADTVKYVPGEKQSQAFTYYVTANERGSSTVDATYLQISGFYGPSHDKPIVYTCYLGDDGGLEHNVEPNKSYDISLAFDGKGHPDLDTRVIDYGGMDFDVDSNCYMLAPSPHGTSTYSFNAVHRPNTFWGRRYGIDRNPEYASNFIRTSDEWHARIIWSDFEMTKEQATAFLATKSGTGGGTYMDPCQRIYVNVPSDARYGNVLVGIYKDDPDKILWSWHLWITDYRPDAIDGNEPVDGKFIYAVPGGDVHRFGTIEKDGTESVWAAGRRYGKAYLMDRDLGCVDPIWHASKEVSAKFYQYGRKDPLFTPSNPYWKYSIDMAPTKYNEHEWYVIQAGGDCDVPFSVMNPTKHIIQNVNTIGWWTSDIFGQNKDINGNPQCWNDPDPTDRDADHEEVTDGGLYYSDAAHAFTEARDNKSFFDPCPPGWRVPFSSMINVMRYSRDGVATIDPLCNYIDGNFPGIGNCELYAPLGYLSQKDNPEAQMIYFPKQGFYNYTNFPGNYYCMRQFCDACNSIGSNYVWYGSSLKYSTSKNYGSPVRCIKEE